MHVLCRNFIFRSLAMYFFIIKFSKFPSRHVYTIMSHNLKHIYPRVLKLKLSKHKGIATTICIVSKKIRAKPSIRKKYKYAKYRLNATSYQLPPPKTHISLKRFNFHNLEYLYSPFHTLYFPSLYTQHSKLHTHFACTFLISLFIFYTSHSTFPFHSTLHNLH